MADVMEHLRGLRRRLNGLTVQDAVAVCAAVVLLIIAALIILALRTPARFFAPVAVSAFAAFCGIALLIAWRVWRSWLSLQETAYLADRRAGLDDRLATLLAASGRRGRSTFLPLLVDQTLARVSQWGVNALAPRRFARSLVFLPIALAILLATAFYARPPARPVPPTTQIAANQRQNIDVPDARGIAPVARKVDAPRGGGPDNGLPQANAPEGIRPPTEAEPGEPDLSAGEMVMGGAGASQSDNPSAQVEQASAGNGEPDESEGSEAGGGSKTSQGSEDEHPAGPGTGVSDSGEQARPDTDTADGQSAGSDSPRPEKGEPQEPGQAGANTPNWSSAPLAALRDVIRSLLGAPEEVPEGEEGEPAQGPKALAERDGSEEQTMEEDVPAVPDSEAPNLIEPSESQVAQHGLETSQSGDKVQGAPGGPGGAGTGTTGPQGLYAKSGEGTGSLTGQKGSAGKGGTVIAIRLGAGAGGQSDTLGGPGEKRDRPPDEAIEAAALAALASGSPLPDLAAEQSADAALQKVEVSPEYEAIVRQIFTRE